MGRISRQSVNVEAARRLDDEESADTRDNRVEDEKGNKSSEVDSKTLERGLAKKRKAKAGAQIVAETGYKKRARFWFRAPDSAGVVVAGAGAHARFPG